MTERGKKSGNQKSWRGGREGVTGNERGSVREAASREEGQEEG